MRWFSRVYRAWRRPEPKTAAGRLGFNLVLALLALAVVLALITGTYEPSDTWRGRLVPYAAPAALVLTCWRAFRALREMRAS